MIEFFLISNFVGSILTLLVGAGIIWFVRKKLKQPEQNHPAGFWARALCLGIDLAVIDLVNLSVAYHGSLRVAGHISLVITVFYFIGFWLFFSSTPAQMFLRMKIVSQDGSPLKVWQVWARLGMCVFLFIGWIMILFDKKEKKALHDIVAQTKVIYTVEKIKPVIKEGLLKKLQFGTVGVVLVLFISLAVFGRGEKITEFTQSSQVHFFDFNRDSVPEGLTVDLDNNGVVDIFKYDLDNDRVVDFTTFDADQDGVAESIDVNNDGRIDGFDFDNDNKLDSKVFGGQIFIWLWRIWFSIVGLALAGLVVFTIIKERKK